MTIGNETAQPAATGEDEVLQLAAEELSVTKKTAETGRVRVSTQTKERDVLVDENLAHETVEIERVPVGQRIETAPEVRQDGDITIIPVVEEVLAVEKRLMLKEEIRIRRVRTTERHQEKVTLRHQEAVVRRHKSDTGNAGVMPAAGLGQTKLSQSNTVEVNMAYETIVAAFDTRAHADAAVKALRAGGFAAADISIFDEKRIGGAKEPGLWHRLFGRDIHQHEADVYRQTLEEGGVVVSARVMDNEVAHAIAILDLHRPVDVHDRAITSGIAPAKHVEAVEKKLESVPLAAAQRVAVSPKLAEAHDEVLHLAEEQLEVGKKLVESGRTRVRRFVTEREAAADVTLHEEHAEVMRRAITDPKFAGTIDWADKELEVIETAEQALANKTARIVEEVALKKVGKDHVETVKDKLRRQHVEIERVGPDGKVIGQKA